MTNPKEVIKGCLGLIVIFIIGFIVISCLLGFIRLIIYSVPGWITVASAVLTVVGVAALAWIDAA